MARLALMYTGSSSDCASPVTEDARQAQGSTDGTYRWTFQASLPADATGTYSVGIEGYRNVKLLPGTTKEMTARDAGANKVISFSVDGSTMQPRRTVVALANCNSCHYSLSLHGDN